MAHEIYENDNMFSVRLTPWHGMGEVIQENPRTSREAIVAAKLDWEVNQFPVMVNGNELPATLGNVRMDTGECLGLVTDRYQVVQNAEAFDFADYMMNNEDIRYETAGSLRNGRQIWALINLPSYKLLDDEIANYLMLTNSHDGKSAIKVITTNVRVVCNNTLNMSLKNAKRTWSINHMGDIAEKMKAAKDSIHFHLGYRKELTSIAETLYAQKVSKDTFHNLVEEIYPESAKDDVRAVDAINRNRADLERCYFETPDVANYMNTKWGIVTAMSDHFYHKQTGKTAQEASLKRLIDGHKEFDKAYQMLLAA